MTSHLQIAFPTAILRFSEIFTKFHTTFHVHNNIWCHFRDSALELGSWPPFSNDRRSILPLWFHPGTCKLRAYVSASFAYHGTPRVQPHHKYSSVSCSNWNGHSTEYTLETSRSMSTHRKLCTNKIWNAKWYVSCLWRENKVVGIAKPLTKIYIAIF